MEINMDKYARKFMLGASELLIFSIKVIGLGGRVAVCSFFEGVANF